MRESELAEVLALGYELTGVEFKPPGPRTDAYLFATVTRAVLGMANRRDGGLVVIGAEAAQPTVRPVGISEVDAGSWNYDDVMAGLSAAADPFVTVDLDTVSFDGKRFVVLRVHEFETVPVLCKREFKKEGTQTFVLRPAACYVRTRRKPETSEIPSQTEMRELLDLAVQKGVRQFIERAVSAGLPISPETTPKAAERFDAQLGDFK